MTSRVVLLLDDDLVWLRTLQRALVKDGCEVIAFSEPPGLLEAISSKAPSLVVLDYVLRDTTGADVARGLRASSLSIPHLALLSSSLELVGAEERTLFDEVLDKGIGIAEIVRRLGASSRRRAHRSGVELRAVRPPRKSRASD